mgnify:CR=1 FL=1
MNLQPIDDRILVERMQSEEKTAGGILLPDAAREKPQRGKIVAVGPGKTNKEGKRVASIAPSSKALAKSLCRHVDPLRPQVIVELGGKDFSPLCIQSARSPKVPRQMPFVHEIGQRCLQLLTIRRRPQRLQ